MGSKAEESDLKPVQGDDEKLGDPKSHEYAVASVIDDRRLVRKIDRQ